MKQIITTEEKLALVGQLQIPLRKATEEAHEFDKGLVGQYNGEFPLNIASAGHIYYYPLSHKYYECLIDYDGAKIDKPNENFKELSLTTLNEKFNIHESKKYGVRFTGSNPVGVRTHAALGMVANVGVDEEEVVNDFDDVPFYNRPVCCGYHNESGEFLVNAYEGEPGFARDGSNGEVYYECTPFYWNGSYEAPVISASEFGGSMLAPMFDSPEKKVYLPCYWVSEVEGKYTSRSGVYPSYGSCNQHMDRSRKYHTNAHTETMKAHMTEYIMQLVEFATKDLQTVMMGVCNFTNTAKTSVATTDVDYVVVAKDKSLYYTVGQTILLEGNYANKRTITKIISHDDMNDRLCFEGQEVYTILAEKNISHFAYKTGATDNVKASSGSNVSNTDGKHQCKWRGKEAPWADGFSSLCDILKVIEDGFYNIYWLKDPTKYVNGALTEHYVKMNYTVPKTNGWAKTLGVDTNYPFVAITKETGASSNTYLSAYYWTGTTTPAVAFVGGYWNDGRYCSPVSFDVDASPSTSYQYRLARLFVTPV